MLARLTAPVVLASVKLCRPGVSREWLFWCRWSCCAIRRISPSRRSSA